MANITGWGRGTWGEGAWNAPLAVEVTGVSGTTALGSETVVAQTVASVDFRDSLMATSFSQEFGLTVDGFVQDGQAIGNGSDLEDITNTERTQDIVLAAEMDLPSSFTKASCIWETGGTGSGAWFGISEQSGAYFLRFRAGSGTVNDNTTSNSISIAQVAVSTLPQFFDGNTHTVVWAIDQSIGKTEIYIDGQLVAEGQTSDGSSVAWAGSANGGFGVANGTPAGGESDDGSTQFQSSDAFTGTIRSDLRMYKNEFIATQTNSTQTGTAKVTPTGVAGTSALGNEVSFTNVVVVETGLQGTTALGNVVSDGSAVAVATGSAGTSALGNTTESGTGTFSVTGVAGTTALGTAQAFPEFVVGVTSPAVTSAVGNVSVSGTCAFSVTGVAGTSALGEEGTSAGSTVVETGLSATGSVGTITVLPSLTIPVTGSAGTGAIGDALGAGGAQVVEEGLTGTVNIGEEAVSGGATVSVTGVSATGGLDTASTLVTFIVTVVSGNPSNHPYYNQGSTNKYAIGGSTATADVVLTLIEGRTYRFDQSDSSNGGHPIAIYEDADKTTQYTTGVTTNGTAGQAGAYTEITVPIGAPTLFYQCTNHALMGAQLNTDSATGTVVTGGATFATTGVAGTSALGTASGVIPIVVSVTGFGITTSLGTATSSVVSNIVITGVVGTATLGTLNLYGIIANDISVSYTEVTPSQTPNWAA